jgi:uncharacterized protein YcbX
MLRISSLHIYPVKSLGGMSVDQAAVTDRGLLHDRRWMLTDTNNRFVSQRTFPAMAMLQASVREGILEVRDSSQPGDILRLPAHASAGTHLRVGIWEDVCDAIAPSEEADAWFTQKLGRPLRLVYMPDESHRQVDTAYASPGDITSFSDGYPILIIGQASLDDLNARLDIPVPMDRFRPNIVFTGGAPYAEDTFTHFRAGTLEFHGVKPCARCTVTTIDQSSGIPGSEPLRTLSTYRTRGGKVMFGMNLLASGTGMLETGLELKFS